MRGMGLLTVAVCVGLALVAPAQQASALDVQGIIVYQGTFLTDGVPMFYFWGADVNVSGLTDGRVQDMTTGVSLPLAPQSLDRWVAGETFPTWGQILARHPIPTNNKFFFNVQPGGWYKDNVILNYNVGSVGGVPRITYPANLAIGVPLNPNYTWDNGNGGSLQGLGEYLNRGVYQVNTLIYAQWDNDVTAMSWQPGGLSALTAYQFRLTLANVQGGGPQPFQTILGDTGTYWGVRGPINSVNFMTTVPEPMSVMLVGTATLVLVGWRRRRRMT